MAFMTNDAYPGGAKAVDEHIGERITDLVRDVRAGFERQERSNDRIESKFDKMVTQSEFNATIQRLDGQDKTIEEKVDKGLDALRDEMGSGLESLRTELSGSVERVSYKVTKGFDEAAEETRSRTTKTRWIIGAGIAALGAVNAVIFNIIGLIFRP